MLVVRCKFERRLYLFNISSVLLLPELECHMGIWCVVVGTVANESFNHWMNEGNVIFNDALNTFYLQLYGVRHMVKDHLDSERKLLPQHGLLYQISCNGSFICTIPQHWRRKGWGGGVKRPCAPHLFDWAFGVGGGGQRYVCATHPPHF